MYDKLVKQSTNHAAEPPVLKLKHTCFLSAFFAALPQKTGLSAPIFFAPGARRRG
jgi:hypothetical protein